MSSFFTLPASQRKRKRPDGPNASPRKRPLTSKPASAPKSRKPTAPARDDESIASGSTSRSASPAPSAASDGSSDLGETEADQRLKLAERYLDNIRAEVSAGREGQEEIGYDAEEIDRELIASRLKADSAEEKGKLHRFIAADLDWENATSSRARANTLAMTGVTLSADGKHVFACSKDMRIVKWAISHASKHRQSGEKNGTEHMNGAGKGGQTTKPRPDRRNPIQTSFTCGNKNKVDDHTYQHHTAAILCIAVSQDGKFLATGGADRKLIIWDANTLKPLKVFTHHRDGVTGLAFRGNTNQLFSGSKDRTVKIWSLNELTYVETLFGHQDEVVDVAAVGGSQERCVSVGARDRTARLWKVIDESQLVFRGGGASGGSFKRDKKQDRRPQHGVVASKTDPASASAANGDDPKTQRAPPAPTFHEGSLDRVTQIDTQFFVTGSDSGALSLYSLHKKKPLHVYALAHGWDPAPADDASSADVEPSVAKSSPSTSLESIDGLASAAAVSNQSFATGVNATSPPDAAGNADTPEGKGPQKAQKQKHNPVPNASPHANAANAQPTPRYITALACLPYTDVFVTGSWDGYVRVWRVAGGSSDASSTSEADVQPAEGKTGSQRHIQLVAVLDAGPGPIRGVVNDLTVAALGEKGRDGVVVAAAVGKEGRLGRWMGGCGPGGVARTLDGEGERDSRGAGGARNGVVVWVVGFKEGRTG